MYIYTRKERHAEGVTSGATELAASKCTRGRKGSCRGQAHIGELGRHVGRARLDACAAHAPARRGDPAGEDLVRGAALDRAALELELLEERAHHLLEVVAAHALVPVGEDGEADDDVGVRVLGGGRGDVLAQEGHREQLARGGHVRLLLLRREQAVVDAVDLGEHLAHVRWRAGGRRLTRVGCARWRAG